MSESTAIAVPELDLQERLRTRVREVLGNLIPDDALDKFVTQAWRELTTGEQGVCRQGHPRRAARWGNTETTCAEGHTIIDHEPELLTLIKLEMRAALQERVVGWGKEWRQSEGCSEQARQALAAAAASASAEFAKGIAMGAVAAAEAALSQKFTLCSCGVAGVRQTRCGGCGNHLT